MLELIFQGFLEWIYSLILEFWQYFSSALLNIMSMDFAYLRTRMPIIDTIMQSLLAVGWALLIGNLVFQAVKSMVSGLGFEGEDPKLLFARTFVFGFLLLASPQICEICLNLTSLVIELMEVPDAVTVTFADESSFAGLAGAWLLVIICGIIVMFQSFKLIFEMAERYLILAVLTMTAPLAFSMGGSRNTSDIFSGWCRMYGSMCLLMVMHVIFIKMLLSVLSFYPSGLDVLPWMVLVISLVKVAKKIDDIITRIGLNPAITGGSLGHTFPGALSYLVLRTATAQITKAIGKSSGGKGHGRAPNTPPGSSGGPRGTSPAGGTGGARYTSSSASSAASTTSSASSATHTEQIGRQQTVEARQDAARQGMGTAADMPQGPARAAEPAWTSAAQQAGTRSAMDGSVDSPGGRSFSSPRKTSVPQGTRRAPSHVTTTAGVVAGASVAGRAPSGGHQQTNVTTGGGAAGQKPGSTAGTHFTHVTSQQVRGGASDSTIQAAERNNISISRNETGRAHPPGMEPTHSVTGSAVPGRGGLAAGSGPDEPRVVRSTRRPPASESGDTHQSRLATGSQPGTAGTGGAASAPQTSARETRHGRNVSPPPASTAPPVKPARFSSVRQEPHKAPGSGTAPVRGGAPHAAPGMAGTAPAGQRASQTRQTAQRQTARAKSTPIAADTHGARRAATISSVQEKKSAPRNVAPKPPKRKGGAGRD